MYFAPYTLPSKNLRLKKSTILSYFFVKSIFHEKFVIFLFFCKNKNLYDILVWWIYVWSSQIILIQRSQKNSGIYDYTNAKILNEKKNWQKKPCLIDKTNPPNLTWKLKTSTVKKNFCIELFLKICLKLKTFTCSYITVTVIQWL